MKTKELGEVEEHVLASQLGLDLKYLRSLRAPGGWQKRRVEGGTRIFWTELGISDLKKIIGGPKTALPGGDVAPALAEVAVETPEELAAGVAGGVLGVPELPEGGFSEKKSAEPAFGRVVRGGGRVVRVTNPRWAEVVVAGKAGRCRFPMTAGLRPGMEFENVWLSPEGYWVFEGRMRPYPGKVLRSV
jgi:hypothetical protein